MPDGSRTAEVKVGLFVTAAAITLIGGSLWIVGSSMVGARRVPYVVTLDESGGVQSGDRVRIAGVSVGKVQDVELQADDEQPVTMRIALRPEVRLPEGSTAVITTSGVLGTSFLQILPGPAANPALEPGDTIEGHTAPRLEDAMEGIDEISDKVIALLDRTSKLIDDVSAEAIPLLGQARGILSEENAARFSHMAADLDELVHETGPRLTRLMDRLDSLATSAQAGVDEIPGLAAEVEALAGDLRTALGPDGSRLSDLLDKARSGVASADMTLTDLRDHRHELGMALHDLRVTSANLKAFSQTVKERPYAMIRKTHEADRKPGDGVSEDGR